ncbi:MAG TPA: B12-binding domain-containing protein, partial [Flavisolibacter sp.]|nr:B12-binding domain-containing protein [Flavisolibacter sp.]
EKTIKDVCYPFLNKIGHLWSTNNVIPAQEHFSSYIIQNRIIVETEKIGLPPGLKPAILLCAPKGEFHELPLLYLNYLFRKKGWGTLYMGTNISIKELELLSEIKSIRYLYLHLITNFTGQDTDDYLETICRKFPDLKIVASGGGIQQAQRNFVNLQLLHSDQQIYTFIESIAE